MSRTPWTVWNKNNLTGRYVWEVLVACYIVFCKNTEIKYKIIQYNKIQGTDRIKYEAAGTVKRGFGERLQRKFRHSLNPKKCKRKENIYNSKEDPKMSLNLFSRMQLNHFWNSFSFYSFSNWISQKYQQFDKYFVFLANYRAKHVLQEHKSHSN